MSTNLDLFQLSSEMPNKSALVNTVSGDIDAAITEFLELDLTADVLMTLAQIRRNQVFKITASGVSKTLTFVVAKRLMFFVMDTLATNDVTLTLGSTDVVLAAGEKAFVYLDGTTNGLYVYKMGEGGGGDVVIPMLRLIVFATVAPVDDEVISMFVADVDCEFAANFAGSVAKCTTPPASTFVFTVKNNGTNIGTLSVATSGVVTLATTSGTSKTITSGDVITVQGGSTADPDIAYFAATLVASFT